jgi:hypothetical protein
MKERPAGSFIVDKGGKLRPNEKDEAMAARMRERTKPPEKEKNKEVEDAEK